MLVSAFINAKVLKLKVTNRLLNSKSILNSLSKDRGNTATAKQDSKSSVYKCLFVNGKNYLRIVTVFGMIACHGLEPSEPEFRS